jgi:hypothetical protein
MQKNSFIAAFDINSGKRLWQTSRDEIPSWGSPTVYEGKNRTEVITNATRAVRGYDVMTGRELWKLTGNPEVTATTPVVANDLIYITNGYRPVQPIFAIKVGANGDISRTARRQTVYRLEQAARRDLHAYPVVYGDYLYTLANQGVLTCYDAKSGERSIRSVFERRAVRTARRRLPLTASCTLPARRSGAVVKAGPEYELLATTVGEAMMATPATRWSRNYSRTAFSLWGGATAAHTQ